MTWFSLDTIMLLFMFKIITIITIIIIIIMYWGTNYVQTGAVKTANQDLQR